MKRFALLLGLLLGGTAALASPVQMHLLAFQGPYVNGIPTYPYLLQVTGFNPFIGMCDDYYHDGAPGDVWNANVTVLGSGNLSNVRFASSGLTAYQEAGWILLQTDVTPKVQWADMNFAVWHIFNPSVSIDQGAQDWIDKAAYEASIGFPGVNFFDVGIATPVDKHAPPTGDQEFLFEVIQKHNPQVPEPSSLALLGAGLAAAAARFRWSAKS